jgi:hypothetical protein
VRERGLPEVQRSEAAGTIAVTVAQPLTQPERADPGRVPGVKLRHLGHASAELVNNRQLIKR